MGCSQGIPVHDEDGIITGNGNSGGRSGVYWFTTKHDDVKVGQTQDLDRRRREHKGLMGMGSQWHERVCANPLRVEQQIKSAMMFYDQVRNPVTNRPVERWRDVSSAEVGRKIDGILNGKNKDGSEVGEITDMMSTLDFI